MIPVHIKVQLWQEKTSENESNNPNESESDAYPFPDVCFYGLPAGFN